MASDVIVRRLPSTSRARKGQEMLEVQSVVVTPETAEGWLAKNTINRAVSRKVVSQYANDMINGRWRFTGDAIRFDPDGNILDGQHRLLACVKSKVPFETLVIDGLAIETRDYLDMGYRRNTSHVLQFHGYTHAAQLAAAAQWLLRVREGMGRNHGSKGTTPEIVECVARHPGLFDSTKQIYGQDAKKKFVLGPPPSLSIAMHYIGAVLLDDQERADAFLDVFQTGKPDYENDPAQMWRERLIRQRAGGIEVRRDVHYRGLVHVWNMFRKRDSVQLLKVPNEVKIQGLDLKKL